MRRRLGVALLQVAGAAGLVAAWWFASAASTNPFFPPLSEILQRFRELWLFDRFASDVVPSLRNLAVGYALATVIGIGAGVVMSFVRPVRQTLEPAVHFLRSIPPVALVPVLVVLFGFGVEQRLVSITLAAVFPTLIATLDGLRAVDPTLHEVSRAYRLTFPERVLRVFLPAAMPQVLAGMQVSLQVAFVVMIVSEMLGSSEGIGAQTLLASQTFKFRDMWAGIVLLGILGYLINLGFDRVQRSVLSWYHGARDVSRA